MNKLCPRCKQVLPLSSFYHSNKRADGLQFWCKQCHQDAYYKNKDRYLEACHRNTHRLRVTVLTHYGSGQPQCVDCGEDTLECLSIDHIKGGGNLHRTNVRKGGIPFYRWLKNQGFPDGYQTLCMNCQFKKRTRLKEYGGGRCKEELG